MRKNKPAFTMAQIAMILMVIAFIIAVSVPMIIYNNKKSNVGYEDKNSYDKPDRSNYDENDRYKDKDKYSEPSSNIEDDLRRKIDERFSSFENRMNIEMRNMIEQSKTSSNDISNKYICTIEGRVDENGNILPVNSSGNDSFNQARSGSSQRFVFVCEYNYR